jgi:hypothetical protein
MVMRGMPASKPYVSTLYTRFSSGYFRMVGRPMVFLEVRTRPMVRLCIRELPFAAQDFGSGRYNRQAVGIVSSHPPNSSIFANHPSCFTLVSVR